TDLTAPTTLIEVDVTGNANLRGEPDTTSEVLGVVTPGEKVTVNGRTEDNQWLRARFTNAEGGVQVGWLSAGLVSATEDLTTLDAVTPEELNNTSPLQYGPMQAFYFKSGVDDAPCSAAPNSGMMIQTPEGQATVTLWIDEVIIELDGTAFVQADPNGDLTVTTLDGSANVTANGETRTSIAGTSIDVPLNEDLTAAGAPGDPQPLDPDAVQSLPTDLLENPIDVPDPLEVTEGAPAPGSWLFNWNVTEQTCDNGTVWTFENGGVPGSLSVADGGATVVWSGRSYSLVSTGVYSQAYIGSDQNLYQETLTVQALDRITGEAVIDLASTPCTLTVPFTLQLVGN
ncbi:MAG TPA: SH3 domain-containing protein, partial [Phototrophicaceae bacterium]|nr:SH3 domain-containing protein [Phototrophicaceae bacterium]